MPNDQSKEHAALTRSIWDRLESRPDDDGTTIIITAAGRPFDYSCFGPPDVDISDIARSLSRLCRFSGHTRHFYSVAQHSLLVSEKMPGGPSEKLAALLHDGAEAYVCDLPTPLKNFLGSGGGLDKYLGLHDHIVATIYHAVGIKEVPPQLRSYDLAACEFEAEALFPLNRQELEGVGFPTASHGHWKPWNPMDEIKNEDPREVEEKFLLEWERLQRIRCQGLIPTSNLSKRHITNLP